MEFQTGYWHSLDKQSERNVNIPPSQIGIPTHPAKDQLEGLRGRIRLGAKNVELGFMGRGKGSLQSGNTTPGMFGKDERQAIKDLAKINKVNLSLHSGANVMGFSGWDHRSGFDESAREASVNEVRRSIEFAGDTTEGGAVVIHTGEFPRSIYDIKDEKYKDKFEQYPKEDQKAVLYLVDNYTGQVITGIKKDQKIPVGVFDPNDVLKVDPKTGKPETKMRDFKFFEDRAKENESKVAAGKMDKKFINPAYLMYGKILDSEIKMNSGWAREHGFNYNRKLNEYKSLQKEIESLEKSSKPEAKAEAEQRKRKLDEIKVNMNYLRDTSVSHQLRADEAKQKLERATTMEEYGVGRTSESIATLGIEAMETTKNKKLKKPLFIAPENLMIETGYGSHPEELKTLIVESRKKMSKELVEKKSMSKGQADKLASDHIKATFDVGYANTWKKFFKGNDEEFKKWLVDKTKELNKKNIIGHVHISDNFGYEGEHGTIGEGNLPVKGFLDEMNRSGFKGTMIAEPSHNDYKALLGAWRSLESPMYRVDNVSRSWTDIEHSYFGRTISPNYITQTYLPMSGTDMKNAGTWSETPID